jgi:hypothetical protein
MELVQNESGVYEAPSIDTLRAYVLASTGEALPPGASMNVRVKCVAHVSLDEEGDLLSARIPAMAIEEIRVLGDDAECSKYHLYMTGDEGITKDQGAFSPTGVLDTRVISQAFFESSAVLPIGKSPYDSRRATSHGRLVEQPAHGVYIHYHDQVYIRSTCENRKPLNVTVHGTTVLRVNENFVALAYA